MTKNGVTKKKEKAIVLDTGAVCRVPLEEIINNPNIDIYITQGVIEEIKGWSTSKSYSCIVKKEAALKETIKKEEKVIEAEDYKDIVGIEKILRDENTLDKVDPVVRRIIYEAGQNNIGIKFCSLAKEEKAKVKNEIRELYQNHKGLFEVYDISLIEEENRIVFGKSVDGFISSESKDYKLNNNSGKGKGRRPYKMLKSLFHDPVIKVRELKKKLAEHKKENSEFYEDKEKVKEILRYFNVHKGKVLRDETDSLLDKSERYLSKTIAHTVADNKGIKVVTGENKDTLMLAINERYINLYTENGMHTLPDFDYKIMMGRSMDKVDKILIPGKPINKNNANVDKNLVSNASFNRKLSGYDKVEIWTVDVDIPQLIHGVKYNLQMKGKEMRDITYKMFEPKEYNKNNTISN